MTAGIVRRVGTTKTTGIPAGATIATATTVTIVDATIMVPLVAADTMTIATERETGMKTANIGIAHPAASARTEDERVKEGEVGVMLPQSIAHPPQKVPFLFPSVNAPPPVGIYTPLDMNDIRLYRQKRQVGLLFSFAA
jgi:hypothetical protein